MDGHTSLGESARSLVHEVVQLARQEVRAAVRSIAPEYRMLRIYLVTAAVGVGIGLCGVAAAVASLVLLLGLAMPMWLAAFLVAASLGAGSAVFLIRARRIWRAWTEDRPLVTSVPPTRSLH